MRIARDTDALNFEFDQLKKFQNRILPGSITIAYGSRKLLTFAVDTVGPIAGNDAGDYLSVRRKVVCATRPFGPLRIPGTSHKEGGAHLSRGSKSRSHQRHGHS